MSAKSGDEAVELMFVRLLGRLPDEEERTMLGKYLSTTSAAEAELDRERVDDAVWAVVTSAEFRFNH